LVKWGADDQTLFYLKQDETKRPFQVYRKKLGSDDSVEDQLIFEELDELYWTGIYKSLDGKYLFVEASSKETTEIHFLDLTDPNATLQCVAKRRPKVLYEIEHRHNQWWLLSNVGGLPNMALFTAPATADCQDSWKLVVDASGQTLFDGGYDRALDHATCFQNHVVFGGREGGLPRVWVARVGEGSDVKSFDRLAFEEEAYDVGLEAHYEFNTDKIVVEYDSLVTPTSSVEIDMDKIDSRVVLKERAVPGYHREQYACERTTALARDGKTEIPVSIVYRKDVMEEHLASNKPLHVHLYGYGSYGACMEASFSSTRLTLLNRGIVYVIAHVRGGGEMGRQWYEEPNGAKYLYLCKKNTFNDFVDVARWLIEDRKLTIPDKMSCEGRSAGGLLIGASINQAPELFQVALLGVPFVDVLCTMTDASIPLTTTEWEEWGNPSEEKYHQYMKEYCPMQNVQQKKYPTCLLTGGLWDPRVAYWEPAKFAATLRHGQSPDSGPVCVKMDMSAGHFSASDRYKYLKELSFDYAFVLDHLGLAEQ
jgi:oligopeptidase B